MNFLKLRTALPALLLAATFALSASVSAQPAFDAKSDAWWSQLETQLSETVGSSVAQVQEDALRQVIFFAENYGHKADFTEAAYEIMGQFEVSGADDAHRVLYLAAISAIGNEATMERLAQLVANEYSPRVRTMASSVLSAYAASL